MPWDTSEDQNLTSEQAYVLNLPKLHTENSVGDNVVLLIVGIEGDQSSEDSREVVIIFGLSKIKIFNWFTKYCSWLVLLRIIKIF